MLKEHPSPARAQDARPLVLGVAGPCGSGKTRLTAALDMLPDVGVVSESYSKRTRVALASGVSMIVIAYAGSVPSM